MTAALTDTIAASATPAGTSAIAVVRASGPAARALATALLGREPVPRSAAHFDYRTADGRLLDDGLLTYFAGPHSYTGEDAVEISIHGNPLIVQQVLEDLHIRGCRPAEAGEFTRRAFLSGRLDLAQAEAVMDVIHARSERALAAATQQLRGSLGRHLDGLTQRLLRTLAHVEAYIDFPDEDLPPEDRHQVAEALTDVLRGTKRLLATHHYGDLLREGIKTVILGEPNAGKSSLLNRLAGYDRALVSPEPGTTRDYLEERILLGPHWIRLIDTAGLNPAPGDIERRGIAKTLERLAEADLILLVLDATRPAPPLPAAAQAHLHPAKTFVLLNKIDLLPSPAAATAEAPPGFTALTLSAHTGAGIDTLTASIAARADALRPDVGEELIAINARHAHALTRAVDALACADRLLSDHGPAELLASELRGALEAYGEIAGRIDNERVLDQLFASFCIGK